MKQRQKKYQYEDRQSRTTSWWNKWENDRLNDTDTDLTKLFSKLRLKRTCLCIIKNIFIYCNYTLYNCKVKRVEKSWLRSVQMSVQKLERERERRGNFDWKLFVTLTNEAGRGIPAALCDSLLLGSFFPITPPPSTAEINFSHGQLLIFIDFHALKEAIFFAALSSRPIYTSRADAWPGENREMGS